MAVLGVPGVWTCGRSALSVDLGALWLYRGPRLPGVHGVLRCRVLGVRRAGQSRCHSEARAPGVGCATGAGGVLCVG